MRKRHHFYVATLIFVLSRVSDIVCQGCKSCGMSAPNPTLENKQWECAICGSPEPWKTPTCHAYSNYIEQTPGQTYDCRFISDFCVGVTKCENENSKKCDNLYFMEAVCECKPDWFGPTCQLPPVILVDDGYVKKTWDIRKRSQYWTVIARHTLDWKSAIKASVLFMPWVETLDVLHPMSVHHRNLIEQHVFTTFTHTARLEKAVSWCEQNTNLKEYCRRFKDAFSDQYYERLTKQVIITEFGLPFRRQVQPVISYSDMYFYGAIPIGYTVTLRTYIFPYALNPPYYRHDIQRDKGQYYQFVTSKIFINQSMVDDNSCVPWISQLCNVKNTKIVTYAYEPLTIKMAYRKPTSKECQETSMATWELYRMSKNNMFTKRFAVHTAEGCCMVTFPPYSFKIGFYLIRFTMMHLKGSEKVYNFQECLLPIYNGQITARFDSLVKVVDYKKKNQVFVEVRDTNKEPAYQKTGLVFKWSCTYNGTGEACKDVHKLFKNSATVNIPAGTLEANTYYNFTVRITSTSQEEGAEDTSIVVSQKVIIGTADKFQITLICETCDDSLIFSPQQSNLILIRTLSDRSAPLRADYKWTFAEVSDESNFQPVETIKDKNCTSYYVLKIKKNAFKFDTSFVFRADHPTNINIFSEIEIKTPSLQPFLREAFNCTLSPLNGIRGWTDFNFECVFEEAFLFFEFYDKDENDDLMFGGRMIGYNNYGALESFKMAKGKFVALVFDKYSVIANFTLMVPLESFNDTLTYLEGLNSQASEFVSSKIFDWPSSTMSLVAAVIEQEMNPPPHTIKEPVLILNRVFIDETLGLVKMVLSSLKVILENIDKKFKVLELDAHLTKSASATLLVLTLKLLEREGNLKNEPSLSRTVFFDMIKVVFDCAEILLEQQNQEFRSKSEEYVNPDISELVQATSIALVTVLETTSYSLIRQQIAGDVVGVILSEREKLLGNSNIGFFEDLGNWTRTTANCSLVINNDVISALKKMSHMIGVQYIRMKLNPFWWAGGNIVTEVILAHVCLRENSTDCRQQQYFRDFIHIHLEVIESLDNLTSIEGTAYRVDPKATDESKELELTVYRLFLPMRAKLFLKFSLQDSQEYRVMLSEDVRPDYDFMISNAKLLNKNSSNYDVPYDNDQEYDKVYYLGILPEGNVGIGESSSFKLKAYYSLCNSWVRWQWTSSGCWLGAETNDEVMRCDCHHLSVVAGEMTSVELEDNPIVEFSLYLTTWENLFPLFILLFILLIYLLLLIWCLMKDRKNRPEGDVIVLDDNFPGEHYAYLLGVHTGSRLNSGTDAAVGVRLFGDLDDSRPHILKSSKRSVLKAFSEDWFLIYTPRTLGKIRRLWIWQNSVGGGSDWFVDTIDLYDLKTKMQYIFEINSWLAIDVDANPDIFLAPVKVNEYFSGTNVFRNNLVNGLKDTNTWTSLCLKHPRNPVSRVERVNVIACYVFTAMAMCLLLYLFHFNIDVDEDKPYYSLEFIDIFIFVLTLIAASSVLCVVMGIFRKSFTHRYKVFKTPRTFRLSEASEASARTRSVQFSGGEEFTTFHEPHIKEYRDLPMVSNTSSHLFKLHKKPPHLRTTRENCVLALHKIAHGTALLPLQLPGSKSALIVRKPWFITAWLLCIFTIIISTIIIMCFAWKLPTVKDEKFLVTFLVVVVFDLSVISFFKILLFSAVLSYTFQNVLPGTTYHIRIRDGARLTLFGDKSFLANLIETRKQRIYYPMPESVKEKRMKSKIRRYRWRILVEFIMVIVLVSVICILCNLYYVDRYMSNTHASELICVGDDMHKLNLDQVFNRTDYSQFFDYNYVEYIYRFMWYNNVPLMNPESPRRDWANDCVTRLLGNTRIRQLRISLKNCTSAYFRNSEEFCAPSWADGEEDKNVYATSWGPAEYEDTLRKTTTWRYTDAESSNSSTFYGRSGTLYHGGGYIAGLGYTKRETRGTLVNLEVEGWLDHQTRAVFVELTLYNVNTDLFTQVVLVTEQKPTGQYISLPKVDSVSTTIAFDLWNISFIIIQVLFLLKALYFANRIGIFVYFSSILNKYDVFLLVLGFATVAGYIIHVNNSSYYVEDFHRKGLDEYFSFFEIMRYDFMSKAMMCFLFLSVVVKLLLSWRFGRIYVSFFYSMLLSWTWIVWLTSYFSLWLIILWRFIGYTMNVYIFSYYSIAIIYSKDFKVSGEQGNIIDDAIIYLMCIISSFVILLFIASFTHYYRVGRYFKPFDDKKIDNFNYGIFLKTELERLVRRKEKTKE